MQREKLYERLKNNPRNVDFNELVTLLEGLGFEKKLGKGGAHISFRHPELQLYVHVAKPHPHNKVLPVYVNRIVKAIEKHPQLWERR